MRSMSESGESSAKRSFLDAVAEWRESGRPASHVVDAAVDLVIELEAPGDSLVAVAALSTTKASVELSSVVDSALDELGCGLLRHGDPVNQLLAGAAVANAYVLGQVELKQLTSVAHDRFGHHSHKLLAALADVDDMLSTVEYFQNPKVEQLHAKGHALAVELLRVADAIYERDAVT